MPDISNLISFKATSQWPSSVIEESASTERKTYIGIIHNEKRKTKELEVAQEMIRFEKHRLPN